MPSFKSFRSREAILLTLLYGVLAFGCTRLPLLHAAGYESSFVFALAGSVAAMLLATSRLRRLQNAPNPAPALAIDETLRVLRRSIADNLLLLLLPLAILLANAFVVRNCSIAEGIAFYVLLPGVSVCFSTALAFFCCMHYRHPRVVFLLLMLLTFAYAGLMGYTTPAIFSYNFFYGYFTGFTYDEGLRITLTLVSFRLVTLGLGAAFLWAGVLLLKHTRRSDSVWIKGRTLVEVMFRPSQRGFSIGIVVLIALIYWFRCDLGYESTASYIENQLGGVLRTEHFTIYYPRNLYDDHDLQRIADEHEFRLKEIMDLFNLPNVRPITSFIYPSADAKLRLIGAGNTDIAKPWSNQVHVTAQSLLSTLHHELVHVVAGRFGRPVIHASFSMGLTEGLATALDWEWGSRTVHEYAAAMRALDIAPDITSLMTPIGFISQSSSVSYVLAGSFCRYLIDRYGIRKFLQVYGSEDYRTQYGRPLRVLIIEWQDFLDRIDLDQTDLTAAEVFFRRPSIFSKTCPRIVGERNRVAAHDMEVGNYAVAESLYTISSLQSQGYEALAGHVTAALRLGKYDTVLSVLDCAVLADTLPERLLPLSLQRGDALWALGRRDEAFHAYRALRSVDLSDAYSEAAGTRMLAVHDDAIQLGCLRFFLKAGPDSVRLKLLDSIVLSVPDRPLLHFLRGRLLLRNKHFEETARALDSINLGEGDPVLEALRYTSLGYCSYALGRYNVARSMFWLSLNWDDSEVAEHEVASWVERCEWKNTRIGDGETR